MKEPYSEACQESPGNIYRLASSLVKSALLLWSDTKLIWIPVGAELGALTESGRVLESGFLQLDKIRNN